jgi:hypothetical protein
MVISANETQGVPEWNIAAYYLRAIAEGFALADLGVHNKDSYQMLTGLSIVFLRLSAYLKQEDIQKLKETYRALSCEVNKIVSHNIRGRHRGIPKSLNEGLEDFYLELQSKIKDTNMLMKTKDDFMQPESW